MALKKSDLYSSLWASCDELRGSMDASQYKDYVLVLLFVKYVTDKYASKKGALIEVPKGGSFDDMVALKGDKEIGDKINTIIGTLAKANQLQGIIDVANFNDPAKLGDGKEMVDRLSNLVAIFEDLNLGANRAEGDDLLGDAYEYLMRNFATQSGKSKGQFYTPAEVSRIMAQVIGLGTAKDQKQTIYDPTCGSGSLLLKAHDEAKNRANLDLAIYGQEKDNSTAALAVMNMWLHECPFAVIAPAKSTISSPYFTESDSRLKTFDFVVANPPFSDKAWSTGVDPAHDIYRRFEYGVPPKRKGDFAYLVHLLGSLKSTGKGAIILPHGVLFRGNVEAEIRRKIIQHGYIKGIIGLPPNLFYGTGIPACIIVLDKEHASARKGIFMIDASKGFIKDGNKNRLREQDIHKIVDTFTRQAEIPKYSRMVPLAEISDSKNDYNLNIPRYIDSTEPEDLQDIEGHLKGGIPDRDVDDQQRYWDVLPSLREVLFEPFGRQGYSKLKVPIGEIKPTVFHHPEFTAFNKTVSKTSTKWQEAHRERLENIKKGQRPKDLIIELGESILAAFAKTKLVDAYDMYQHLMEYWAEVMQDDVYQIVEEGWKGLATLRVIKDEKDKKIKEKPDLVIAKQKYKIDFIQPSLIIYRCFKAEQTKINKLQAECDELDRQMEEMREEHGGDEGLLNEAVNDKGNITKGDLTNRIKEIEDDSEFQDELEMLNRYLDLYEHEAEASKKVKEAQKELDNKVFAKYPKLTIEEIKTLVIDDKWLTKLSADVQGELDRVSQRLTGRIKQLAERYMTPLPVLDSEVADLTKKVHGHLTNMGFTWK